jgi:hypothetical protein
MPAKDKVHIIMGTSKALTKFSPTSTSVLVEALSVQDIGYEIYVKHVERGVVG